MPRSSPWHDVPTAPADLDLHALAEGRDLELDVGFGRGHFLLARAEACPDSLLVGLEMRRKWVGLAAQRAQARGLENVIAWYGDARHILSGWGPDGSVAAVYVHFPDPWWKKKHRKRMVVSPPTVTEIARLLRPGGTLLVQTDVEERASVYRRVLEGEPRLREALGSEDQPLDHNPSGVPSHREKKCAEAGLPVFRLFFEKISSPS